MYIIDETYFIQDISVPQTDNLDVVGSDNTLTQFIDKYARLLLKNALGITLFNLFDGSLTDGVLNDDADQKWKDLVNGKIYSHNGVTKVWKGLKFTEGIFKGSVLAHYTYYHWYLWQMSQITSLGEVKGKSVNASSVNENTKLVQIWNEFLQMYLGNSETVGTYSVVNGVPFYDYFSANNNEDVSLLQFIKDNDTDYPDAQLRLEQGFQNQLGL
jgi:hypothetical protein